MVIEKRRDKMEGASRWLMLAGGSAAVIWGLKRRGILGSATALAGANFAVMGLTGERNLLEWIGLATPLDESPPYGRGIKIRRSVTINRPADQLYRFWRNFENLPRFMTHIESVRVHDGTHSHWIVKTPRGRRIEWNAEITAERENELIGWRASGTFVGHAGSVRFEKAPDGRGAIVRVQLQYDPAGGKLAANVARLFGGEPEQLIREALSGFKQLMETGEIATTEGQSSGRRERRLPGGERPRRELHRKPEPVEEGSEESFPASDAPAWMSGGGSGD